MSKDKEQIQDDIISDFGMCLGAFEICKRTYESIINPNDGKGDPANFDYTTFMDKTAMFLNKREMIIVSERKKFLVDLGNVLEMAFKYLLKIEQKHRISEDYQNFIKHFYQSMNKIKDLVNKGKLSENDYNEIVSLAGTLIQKQKEHNCGYLEFLIMKLMPQIHSSIEKIKRYSILSNMISQKIEVKMGDDFDLKYLIFPCLLDDDIKETYGIKDDVLDTLIYVSNDVVKEYEDVFFRLRFHDNDVHWRFPSIEDAKFFYKYVEQVVNIVDSVYEFDENIMVSAESIYGRSQALKYSKLIGKTEEEIEFIFKNFNDRNPSVLSAMLLTYKTNEIERIEGLSKQYGVISDEVYKNGIKPDRLIFFHEKGVNSPYLMMVIDDALYSGDINHNEIDGIISDESRLNELVKKYERTMKSLDDLNKAIRS